METTVDVVIEDDRWKALGLEALAARAATAALVHIEVVGAEISLLACDDARIAALNADFRGKPTPTNVLSWPSEERAAEVDGGAPDLTVGEDPEIGDIAIAYEICVREAHEAGREMADHVTHLIIHGTLHLMGYDHERDGDAAVMEQTEVAILAGLGISDPYTLD